MNSQYYHHYNYCTLYIYSSSIISHTRNNPDPSFIEPSFCDVHRAVPLHEYAHDLQVALQPQSQLWKSMDFPDIFGQWSIGWFSTSSFYHWERDVLVLCLLCPFWGDPGSPDMAIWEKSSLVPDGSLKATAGFFCNSLCNKPRVLAVQ